MSGDATLTDFDERDLVHFAEEDGFDSVELDLELRVGRGALPDDGEMTWDLLLRTSGNPRAPTFGEAMEAALTAEERARFQAQLRPLFEGRRGRRCSAGAYLRARA